MDQLNARIQSGFHYMLYVDIFIGEGVVVALTTPMLPVRGVSSCNFWPEEVSNLMLARSTNNLKLAGKSAQLIEKATSAWVCVIRSM